MFLICKTNCGRSIKISIARCVLHLLKDQKSPGTPFRLKAMHGDINLNNDIENYL